MADDVLVVRFENPRDWSQTGADDVAGLLSTAELDRFLLVPEEFGGMDVEANQLIGPPGVAQAQYMALQELRDQLGAGEADVELNAEAEHVDGSVVVRRVIYRCGSAGSSILICW